MNILVCKIQYCYVYPFCILLVRYVILARDVTANELHVFEFATCSSYNIHCDIL
jgi:hypothetical protein